MAPVSSSERSSTTITSSAGYVDASIDRTHRAMFRASFRAGTITETSGASAGASGDSSSSERESRKRQSVTAGSNSHGSAAANGVQFTYSYVATTSPYRRQPPHRRAVRGPPGGL